MTHWRAPWWLLLLAVATGCGDTEAPTIRISVASSLAEVVEQIAADFETQSAITVEINVASSSTIVRQVDEGATVDLIMTADRIALDPITDRISDPVVVARNTLVLAHRADAAPPIDDVDDLVEAHRVAGCDRSVPCGRLLQQALSDAMMSADLVDTLESNVRQVGARLTSGEADAGFVYRTDVERFDRTEIRWLPLPESPTGDVTMAQVRADPTVARFSEFVLDHPAFSTLGFEDV